MGNEPTGRKEITESVIIAALCALATGLVNWGIEAAKAKTAQRKVTPPAEPPPSEGK